MRRVSAHQIHFMPWLGYLKKLADVDLFIMMDDVQFDSREFVHRNKILSDKGPLWLTAPIDKESKKRGVLLKDVRIAGQPAHWRTDHFETLRHQYGNAPGWKYCEPMLNEVYRLDIDYLVELNMLTIYWLKRLLEIKTPLIRVSSAWGCSPYVKSDRILWYCQQAGADVYLSGPFGRDYLDLDAFRKAGIAVEFQDYDHPVYPQRHSGEFVPNLSALDLLLNCGPDSVDIFHGGM